MTWNGIVTLTKSHLEQIVHLALLSVTFGLNLAPLRRGHTWALFGRRSSIAVASGTRRKELRATVITRLRWSSAERRDGHCQTMTPKQALTDMLTNLGWRSLQQRCVDSALVCCTKSRTTKRHHVTRISYAPQGEDHATCMNSPSYLYHAVLLLIVCHSFYELYRSGTIYLIMYLVTVTLSISFAIVFRHFNTFL